MRKLLIFGATMMIAACGQKEQTNVAASATQSPEVASATAAPPPPSVAPKVAQREENWSCNGSLGDFRIKITGFETSRMGGASVITTADGTFSADNPFGGKKKVVVEIRGNDGDIYDIDGNEFQKSSGNPNEMGWISESGDPVECKKR